MARKEARKFFPETVVTAVPDQVCANLDDGVIILHLHNGVYYSLNQVGTRIWNLIQKPMPVREICDIVLSEYEVESTRCERDLLELLQELAAHDLITLDDGKTA